MANSMMMQPQPRGEEQQYNRHSGVASQHHQPSLSYGQGADEQVYTGTRPTSEDVDTIRPSQSASAVQPRRNSTQLQYPHFIRHQHAQPQRTGPTRSAEGRSYTLKNTLPEEAFREVERIYGSRVTASSSAPSVVLPFDEDGNPRDAHLANLARDSLAGLAHLPGQHGQRESGLGLYDEGGNVPGPRTHSRRHSAQLQATQQEPTGHAPHRHSFFGGLAWPGFAHAAHPQAAQQIQPQTPTTPNQLSGTAATRVKSILRSGLGLNRTPQQEQQDTAPHSQGLGSPFTPSPEFQAAEAEDRGAQGDVSSLAPSQSLSQALLKQRKSRRGAGRGRAQSKDLSGVDPDRRLTQENLEAVQDSFPPGSKMSTIRSGQPHEQYGGWQDQAGMQYGGEMNGYNEDDEFSPDTVEHGEAEEYPLPPIPPSTAAGRARSVRSQGQALGLQMIAEQTGGGVTNWATVDASHRHGPTAHEHQAYPQNLMPGYGQPHHAGRHQTGTIRTRSNLGWESPPLSDGDGATELQSAVERMTVGGTTVLGGRSAVTGMTGIGGMPSTMTRMRAKLEDGIAAQNREEAQRNRRAAKASKELGSTKRHAEALSEELRKLQAQIIAEKVGRCETEKKAMKKDEQIRVYRDELAAAVRALERAKNETKRLEEERRKGARLYEETKERLIKYHEAIQVQKARDEGHEQGRLEAFAEIQRWMTAPPIPVEPLEMLPSNALQTPQLANQQPSRAHDQGMAFNTGYQAQGMRNGGQAMLQDDRYQARPIQGDQRGHTQQDAGPDLQTQTAAATVGRPQARPVQRTQGYTASIRAPLPQGGASGMASSQGMHRGGYDPEPARGTPALTARRSSGPDTDRGARTNDGRSNYAAPSQSGIRGDLSGARAPDPPSSGDLPSLGRVHAPLSSVPRPPTADAYLERIPNDPRLRDMLDGAASGTVPINVPPASAGFGSQAGSAFGYSSDKPLPDPSKVSRARSAYDGRSRASARSQGGMLSPTSGSQGGSRNRRQGRGTDLSQENRYPAFSAGHAPDLLQHSVPVFDNPPGARSMQHQSQAGSMQQHHQQAPRSVDPRMIGLPESRAPSAVGVDHRRTNSAASAVRSKLAAGLRGDDEVSLSMIDEREEQEQQMVEMATEQQHHQQAMQAPSVPPPAARRAPARSLASMPNFRNKPKPVMPGRLAAPASEFPAATGDQPFSADEAQARLGPATWQQPQRMQGPPTINLIPPSRSSHAGASQAGYNAAGPSQADMTNAFNRNPQDIPLPPTRGNTAISGMEGRRHNPVASIDWAHRAAAVALPESRPTTMISPPATEQRSGPGRHAATVETIEDAQDMGLAPKSGVGPSRRKTSTWVTYQDEQ